MIGPFILGIAAAVVAKPVFRATYRGCVKLKTEADLLMTEAKSEVAAEQQIRQVGLDPPSVQTVVENAVNRAVERAMARQPANHV